MSDEFTHQVGQIHGYVAALHGLAGEIDALRPQQVRAGDATGSVQVVLGPEGFPESAQIGPDWRRRVGSERFGSAVAEACQAAQRDRLAAWTQALESGDLLDKLERLGAAAERDIESLQVSSDQRTAVPQAGDHHVRVPPLPERLVLEAADAVEAFDVESARSARGSGFVARGKLTVDFAATGVVTCEADPDWVARQEADTLTDALDRAFAAAREDLAANAPRQHPALAQLMSAVSEPWR